MVKEGQSTIGDSHGSCTRTFLFVNLSNHRLVTKPSPGRSTGSTVLKLGKLGYQRRQVRTKAFMEALNFYDRGLGNWLSGHLQTLSSNSRLQAMCSNTNAPPSRTDTAALFSPRFHRFSFYNSFCTPFTILSNNRQLCCIHQSSRL